MSGRFSEYVVEGDAPLRRVRSASAVDNAAAFLIGVIVFPFPIVRAYVPVWVFVVSILLVIGIAHALYVALMSLMLGRTPGMYLFDLGFLGQRPDALRSALWGFASAVVFWPSLIAPALVSTENGVPTRISGLRIGATRS